MSEDFRDVPDYLMPYIKMLRCAYPKGLSENEYFPLLGALGQIMNHRGTANVVSAFVGREYGIVFNDVLASQSSRIPDPQAVASVVERLKPCGFELLISDE